MSSRGQRGRGSLAGTWSPARPRPPRLAAAARAAGSAGRGRPTGSPQRTRRRSRPPPAARRLQPAAPCGGALGSTRRQIVLSRGTTCTRLRPEVRGGRRAREPRGLGRGSRRTRSRGPRPRARGAGGWSARTATSTGSCARRTTAAGRRNTASPRSRSSAPSATLATSATSAISATSATGWPCPARAQAGQAATTCCRPRRKLSCRQRLISSMTSSSIA
mmetsp:Transcript_76632/g.248049  ORF Transcript_76632/g.248049 Transcript_76632/m.248049 type:complete len:219 (+) Transcript_76632:470-1126(+)